LRHRPTERISRDFVPWRFSDAGRRSVGLGRRSRRPKTCTVADIGRVEIPQCSGLLCHRDVLSSGMEAPERGRQATSQRPWEEAQEEAPCST